MIPVSHSLPTVGTAAPSFTLTRVDRTDVQLSEYLGKRVVLNIFPSIDTSTCAMSVRRFNQLAAQLTNTVVLCISKDLPFAQKRFCGAEGIENVETLSQYRNTSFSDAYGVDITDTPMRGLMSRNVVVIDENGTIIHTEACELGQEPNYEAVLEILAV
jgi:thioredoxin-dependent peroxiredoxin